MMEFKDVVKFVLGSMVELALEDESYSFLGDLEHYYDSKIKGKMSPIEFETLTLEVLKEKNVPKHSLR